MEGWTEEGSRADGGSQAGGTGAQHTEDGGESDNEVWSAPSHSSAFSATSVMQPSLRELDGTSEERCRQEMPNPESGNQPV